MSIITRINKAEKRIVDLYNKLKNLPSGGGGVQTISGDFVDNTDPLNPILNDPRPYKVYTALLTQSGTKDPVATVLENTLGNISFDRYDQGYYGIISDNLFTPKKTFIVVGGIEKDISNTTIGYVRVQKEEDTNTIYLQTSLTNIPGYRGQDDWLKDTPIEIRVYN